MQTAGSVLYTLTEKLLSPGHPDSEYQEAVSGMYRLFCDMTGFEELDPVNQDDIFTDYGKAIAPRWAASCILDFRRTRNFLLATREAIEVTWRENPLRPVTLLYAGTGPFATLITPLVCYFSPAQLQLVLLEVQDESFRHLGNILRAFDMEAYSSLLQQADAADWIMPGHISPDIVLAETMTHALEKEPQAAIAGNLLAQCGPATRLIPELIRVDACLLNEGANLHGDQLHLGTILSLDAVTAVKMKIHPADLPVCSTGITLTIPKRPPEPYNSLALQTHLHIAGTHQLANAESGLTIPKILMRFERDTVFPLHLWFRYRLTNDPGFDFRIM